MKRLLMVAALAVGFGSAALAEDIEAQPTWINFKPGSWSRTKNVMKMDAGAMKMETVTVTTAKLVEITDTEVVIEYEIESSTIMNGAETKTPAQKSVQRYPRKVKKPETTEHPVDAPKGESGDEEVEVGGKKLKCKWFSMTTEASGMKTESKSWTCEEVPGWSVKTVAKTSGAAANETTMTLEAFEAK